MMPIRHFLKELVGRRLQHECQQKFYGGFRISENLIREGQPCHKLYPDHLRTLDMPKVKIMYPGQPSVHKVCRGEP